jgi:AcrR family transcriptional regulator
MPKISEPTVAEHRAARRAALLDAAADLLAEDPTRRPGLGAVAERAGLSRPSAYHYFSSVDDLLVALVERTFPRWERRFDEALSQAGTPEETVRAFVRESLRLVADGEHALARTLATVAPGERLDQRVAALNHRLLQPVVAALAALGVTEPEPTARLLRSLVLTAGREVESSGDAAPATTRVLALVDPFLAAHAADRAADQAGPDPVPRPAPDGDAP